jgi:hypothetical protein
MNRKNSGGRTERDRELSDGGERQASESKWQSKGTSLPLVSYRVLDDCYQRSDGAVWVRTSQAQG